MTTPAPLAFVSLARLHDDRDHRAYNEWHQLDHRPENLALDGVRWGERWVRSPDCAAADAPATGELGPFHYLNTYWFTEPADRARAEFAALAERSFQWGRRDDVRLCSRPMMGWFVPVRTAVSPRLRLSPEALPIRPNRGVHLEVLRIGTPRGVEVLEWCDWWDRERLPALAAAAPVAGVVALVGEDAFAQHADLEPGADRPLLRLHLTYLEGDPVEAVTALAGAGPAGLVTPEVVHAGVLRAIQPWAWDWFDAEGTA
jgi:hypothetical protein